jgi:hypothetical protein
MTEYTAGEYVVYHDPKTGVVEVTHLFTCGKKQCVLIPWWSATRHEKGETKNILRPAEPAEIRTYMEQRVDHLKKKAAILLGEANDIIAVMDLVQPL